ncbi:hypothetical protein BOTBODRAFT_92513, partial [Botryobasidium botryosum FD-172 SS1]
LLTRVKTITGKIHVGVDGWSSPNTISFLGIMLHFFHEGRMQKLILDFIPMTEVHTGKQLAQ